MTYRALSIGLLLSLATVASADPRPWTFTYDTYAAGKGNWEFEQWVTWETRKKDEKGYDRFVFREEIEYGVAD
ncbi:MAG TPA: hypothetical protein VM165_24475, partial [Planctomycetaceae bacterium]|nr:hypothetical protein [Planctomycetaceae bacterium]